MATTRPTDRANHHAPVAVATVVLVLSAVVDFANLGGYLSGASIPPAIVGIWVALGVAALGAAGGLWSGRRWATPLAIALALVTVLLGVLGAFTAGSTTGRTVSVVDAILGLVVIALLAVQMTRRAAA